jgi:hypothetical protein
MQGNRKAVPAVRWITSSNGRKQSSNGSFFFAEAGNVHEGFGFGE